MANFVGEVVGTMVLVMVAGAIFSHGVSDNGPAAGMGQWLVGSLVWGIGLSLGGTTGYAINPARDLGPRLAHGFLPIPGKGGSNWRYAPIPISDHSPAARWQACCFTSQSISRRRSRLPAHHRDRERPQFDLAVLRFPDARRIIACLHIYCQSVGTARVG